MDARPRHAIEQARAWTRGEITMSEARAAGDRPRELRAGLEQAALREGVGSRSGLGSGWGIPPGA